MCEPFLPTAIVILLGCPYGSGTLSFGHLPRALVKLREQVAAGVILTAAAG